MKDIFITPIGYVSSDLTKLEDCPKQTTESTSPATITILPEYGDALDGLVPGKAVVLTWLDKALRTRLQSPPRGNPENALQGVFSTRSPHRPNPIGLHEVEITAINGLTIELAAFEVLDLTPVIDIKSAM